MTCRSSTPPTCPGSAIGAPPPLRHPSAERTYFGPARRARRIGAPRPGAADAAEATGPRTGARQALVLETPTWRANPDWGARLGYGPDELDRLNRGAVSFLRRLGEKFASVDLIVSGNIGPRGDGYDPGELMAPADAAAYHRPQIEAFAAAGVDRVTMLTATHTGEAIGVIRAAVAADVPVVVSFTLETDGRLPAGQTLEEAITEVDGATDSAARHYGINCAHPEHFTDALRTDAAAIGRVELLRANASRASHASSMKPKSSTTVIRWSWRRSTPI